MISVNREEHRLKDCWDITLWMSYGISGLGGCEILFMMWDFIPKCGILFMKTLNLDSDNHETQWKNVQYSDPLYNSSSNNQICFERYPCPTLIYCRYIAFWMIMGFLCISMWDFIQNHNLTSTCDFWST